MNSPQPYLTVASILTGFCISVFMFRIQRELRVRDEHPEWPNWLAWADYLVISAMLLSVLLVVLPLMAFPQPSRLVYSIAAASCGAAAILLLGYPFAILDHYQIEIGTRSRRAKKPPPRRKGEPLERVIVVSAMTVAALVFATTVWMWNG